MKNKFLLIIFALLLFLQSCSKENSVETKTEQNTTGNEETQVSLTVTEEKTTEELPQKTPLLPISFYMYENSGRTKINEYTADFPENANDSRWKKDTWTYPGKTNLIWDVVSFDIFPSWEDSIPGKGYTLTKTAWENPIYSGYKTGFEFKIVKKDSGTEEFTVLSPQDTFKKEEYFEIYLYDDIKNIGSSWYSHVTQSEVDENTVYSSLKITLREKGAEIDKIEITAFLYNDDSLFDSSGKYTGVEKTSVTIINQ